MHEESAGRFPPRTVHGEIGGAISQTHGGGRSAAQIAKKVNQPAPVNTLKSKQNAGLWKPADKKRVFPKLGGVTGTTLSHGMWRVAENPGKKKCRNHLFQEWISVSEQKSSKSFARPVSRISVPKCLRRLVLGFSKESLDLPRFINKP